jgi:methionine aminotransferase
MSKLPHIGTTIFSVMSGLADTHNAINLSQGFPNFPVDSRLTSILQSAATQSIHQYAPMAGNPNLLEKVGRMVCKAYGRETQPTKEILITAGATQAIFTTIQALVGHGQEVIILDPSYDCYEPPVQLTGAKAIRIPLNEDYTPNWDNIEAAMNSKTAMLIMNNPHNPSGTIVAENDILALERLLEKFPHVILLADEVYEFITFEQQHISINTREQLRNRSVIVSSFGKTFHITGWKVGYIVAPEHLLVEIKKVHQFLVFSVNSVAQAALSDYLDLVDVTQLAAFFQTKRDRFRSLLSNSRFELLPAQGTYFQVASYAAISDAPDVEFCKTLVRDFGVAAIPLSVFHADGRDHKRIRFCYAKDEETLQLATERLCKI